MSHAKADRKTIVTRAAISVIVAGMISSAHHVYGAIVYETPWRLLVSLWIPAFVVLVLIALYLHWKFADRVVGVISGWLVFFCGVVFQTGFTLFEYVYSHVLKILLFFAGTPEAILYRLYPAPTYHLPDNLLFELTGVLQLAGFVAAWLAWRVFAQRAGAPL
jgi:hypothetical protein